MKKCPKPLGYGIRRTPVVLGYYQLHYVCRLLFRMQMWVVEWIVSRCSLFCKRIQLKVQ